MVTHHPGMHPEDLKAALRKAGWTYAKLAKAVGVCSRTIGETIRNGKSPKACAYISSLLAREPEEIWPSRYEVVRIRRKTMT